MSKTSPTQRSLKLIRTNGYQTVQIVEVWIPFGNGVRRDLFNFIDILAINDDGKVLAVQTTSYSNISARCKKIADNEHIARVRAAGWKIEVHGWHKKKNK